MKCNLSNKAYYLWVDKANHEIKTEYTQGEKRRKKICGTTLYYINTNTHKHNTNHHRNGKVFKCTAIHLGRRTEKKKRSANLISP